MLELQPTCSFKPVLGLSCFVPPKWPLQEGAKDSPGLKDDTGVISVEFEQVEVSGSAATNPSAFMIARQERNKM